MNHVIVETKDRLTRIELNRPEKMNALSHNLRAELFNALKDFELDPEVKVIIIRGSGRAFSAGYDLSGISQLLQARSRAVIRPRSPGSPRKIQPGPSFATVSTNSGQVSICFGGGRSVM